MISSALAGELQVVSSEYKYQDAPEYQAIMAQLKPYGEFTSKEVPVQDSEKPKVLSRGELMVEEAKAKNRARLAEMYKNEKAKSENTDNMTELEKWKKEERETLNQWKKESKDLLDQWKREQEIFLGRLKVYKENTFVLPVKTEKIVEKKVPVEAIPDVHVINGAFKVPVRDQLSRPTCVAFAGIRAMEILLAQNNVDQDLSEQYLYWAGKPKCQVAPCTEKGSWIREAYSFSQKKSEIDVPIESNCSYQGQSIASNETQIPLSSGCMNGSAKISSFEEVRTLADVITKLKLNIPVVVAAKLTENFYKNKGLITFADSESTGKKLDAHALGHAFLAVGVIELPAKLRGTEGDYCLIVANSWGKGWGAGGYACITQKWFETMRQPSPFIALTKVIVK